MNTALIVTLIAFAGGVVWGYLTPRGYCSISSVEAKSVKYRIGGGLINGAVVGGVAGILSVVFLGQP